MKEKTAKASSLIDFIYNSGNHFEKSEKELLKNQVQIIII